jgi:hypothetical protein
MQIADVYTLNLKGLTATAKIDSIKRKKIIKGVVRPAEIKANEKFRKNESRPMKLKIMAATSLPSSLNSNSTF